MREDLLKRRIPLAEIEVGRAYVIHARNGGVGVAVRDKNDKLGYRLHREKFGDHFLFTEWDWEVDSTFGTAIPLRLLPENPPKNDSLLLSWLVEQEALARAEIQAAWQEANRSGT